MRFEDTNVRGDCMSMLQDLLRRLEDTLAGAAGAAGTAGTRRCDDRWGGSGGDSRWEDSRWEVFAAAPGGVVQRCDVSDALRPITIRSPVLALLPGLLLRPCSADT
eukprot:Hpha_TRINITY_DN15152_c3_g13::TRINITY_DN15152_c3_g13_i2::g.127296::m.127296